MLINLEFLTEKFKNLVNQKKLGQNYLFFGEQGVGKFTFAKCLANYFESGIFEPPRHILIDALILEPEPDAVLGLEAVKQAKFFLWQKPFISPRRTVIVNQADNLTPEAQNVFLRIAEEPPASGFLIMIAADSQSLTPALLSRFAKIYFPRLPTREISRYLINFRGLNSKNAQEIAEISFGRVGRAIELADNNFQGFREDATCGADKSEDAVGVSYIDKVFERYYIILRKDLKKNVSKLNRLLRRHIFLKKYNLNQRIQLKAAEIIFNK